jgi:hypothetical protein
MTSNGSQLNLCQPVTDSHCVQTTDGSFCTVTHQGNLATSQLTVPGVSLVPKLSMNLISVGQLFDDTSCFVQDRRTELFLVLTIAIRVLQAFTSLTTCIHTLLKLRVPV